MSEVQVGKKFILMAIILIPFNALPYFKGVFGELASEAAFYPLLLCILLFFSVTTVRGKFDVPHNTSAYFGTAFLISVLVSVLINADQIISSSIKGRSGTEKLAFQLMVIGFVTLVSLSCYRFFSRIDAIALVRQGILWSLPIPFFVGGLEILSNVFDLNSAQVFLSVIGSIIREPTESVLFARIRTVSGEASWFAMYAGFVLPWLLAERDLAIGRKRTLLLLVVMYLILLIILSQSRTAYFTVAIEFLLYGYLSKGTFKFVKIAKYAVIAVTIVILLTVVKIGDKNIASVFNTLGDVEQNMSNVGRFGSQVAAYNIATEHWVGVGLGQYGFYAPQYYPDFAWLSYEIKQWADPDVGSPWPPVHSLHFRILSEVGWFGLFLWFLMWLAVLRDLWKKQRKNSSNDPSLRAYSAGIFTCVVSLLLSGFNSDSFRFFPYWIILALCWSLPVSNKKRSIKPLNAITCV